MAINVRPALTTIYERSEDFCPIQESSYIFGRTGEDRSDHISSWRIRATGSSFLEVTDVEPFSFGLAGFENQFSLRSERQLSSIWAESESKHFYLDITGLPHHVWAPLLKSLYFSNRSFDVIYAEPSAYKKSTAPVEGQIYDLSEKVRGLSPLPGFASLVDGSARDGFEDVFIAFLGFEGTRFAYVLEEAKPSSEKIVPVVGCPGFKPGYTFETYVGNKRALLETSAWQQIKHIPANCPFSAFDLLTGILSETPNSHLRIATIGTKPHALGAILFKILNQDRTEILYDHPIRRGGRTSGSDRLLVYHVASLKC